jgi:hypothetical protein
MHRTRAARPPSRQMTRRRGLACEVLLCVSAACDPAAAGASSALARFHERLEAFAEARVQAYPVEKGILDHVAYEVFHFHRVTGLGDHRRLEQRRGLAYRMATDAWGSVPAVSLERVADLAVHLDRATARVELTAAIGAPLDMAQAFLEAKKWPLQALKSFGARVVPHRAAQGSSDLVKCVATVDARLAARSAARAMEACRTLVSPRSRLLEFAARLHEAGGRLHDRAAQSTRSASNEEFVQWADRATPGEIEAAWRGAQVPELQLASLDSMRLASPAVGRTVFGTQALGTCTAEGPETKRNAAAIALEQSGSPRVHGPRIVSDSARKAQPDCEASKMEGCVSLAGLLRKGDGISQVESGARSSYELACRAKTALTISSLA